MTKKEELESQDIKKAVQVLKSGGVVIFPTDTVYGVGCCFDDERAVNRIYQMKGREQTQAFPVLVSSIEQAEGISKFNPAAKELVEKHWPGGLTVVIQTKNNNDKIGLRMPDSDLVRDLIEGCGKPIIGTSANFHGQRTPEKWEELDPGFTKLADFVVKGECKLGEQSTVVDTTINPPKVLRQGAVKI